MEKITISDFSGGMLESKNPNDFAKGKWSELKGFIPRDLNTMESQWPAQRIGGLSASWRENGSSGTYNTSRIRDFWPLSANNDTYLVALMENGTFWWSKQPTPNATYTTANATLWYKINTLENTGWDSGDNELQPTIPLVSNPNARFLCDVPFEAFRYIKKPDIRTANPGTDLHNAFTGFTYDSDGENSNIIIRYNTTEGVEIDFNVGDEVYIAFAYDVYETNYGGLWTISATDADAGTITITYGFAGTRGADFEDLDATGTIYNSDSRGNNMDYDTLLDETSYAKSTTSGVLINDRRINTSGTTGYQSGMTSKLHQTLVAYIDIATSTIKMVSFPNIRRWPTYKQEREFIVNTSLTSNVATLTTQDNHTFKKGQWVTITNIDSNYNGTYKITSTPSTTTFTFAKKHANLTSTIRKKGTAEIRASKYTPIKPYVALDKQGTGHEATFIKRYPEQTITATEKNITHLKYNGGYLTFRLDNVTNLAVGDSIFISVTNAATEQTTANRLIFDTANSNGFNVFTGQYVIYSISSNDIVVKRRLTYYLDTLFYMPLTAIVGAATVSKVKVQESETAPLDVYPQSINYGHPYTYLNSDLLMLPGKGFIPRGNVGTMWGGHLIIGDIEWRGDATDTVHTTKKLAPGANNALISNNKNEAGLRDTNTNPDRSAFYYSETDIDEFDPRSVFIAGGSGSRIVGMHQLYNRLVVITTGGSDQDGVLAYTGLLSQLHPYNPGTIANPLAVKKNIIKGGMGPVNVADANQVYDRMPKTTLWKDAGLVAFIDASGAVMYTDGYNTVERLDRNAYILPRGAGSGTGLVSLGKHLIVWQDVVAADYGGLGYARCLVYTLLDSQNGLTGAWTELVTGMWTTAEKSTYPTSTYNVTAMRATGTELFLNMTLSQYPSGTFISNKIIRFATAAPNSEKGSIDNERRTLFVTTQAIGSDDEFTNTLWHNVGITFSTTSGCKYNGNLNRGASLFETQAIVNGKYNYAIYFNNPNKTFSEGLHSIESKAGIGASPVISSTHYFEGDVRIESASVWHSGSTNKRGNINYDV